MTFKHILTFGTLIASLSTSVAIAAALPTNVKSVQAQKNGNEITVLWSVVPGAATYRVYFSHESILGNGGNYDDFEQTADAQTRYVFANPPLKSEKIFIGVLGVDKDGHESEGFEVEASVDNVTTEEKPVIQVPTSSEPNKAPEQEIMPPGENATSTAELMSIESVRALSETGVVVTFTKELDTKGAINEESFLITTASGTVLTIEKVEVRGKEVLLRTMVQASDTEYVLGLLSAIPAVDGTNATPSEPQVKFRSISKNQIEQPMQQYGKKPGTPDVPPQYGMNPNLPGAIINPTGYQPAPGPLDPSGLGLSAVLRKDGLYNVIASWNPAPNAAQYALYTSKNGSPYTWNSAVGNAETTVQYSRIAPGMFGVKVTSRTNNQESRGVDKVIELPASGLGLLGIAAIAGAGAGQRMQRRKKKVV